jgi:hypothetical protein
MDFVTTLVNQNGTDYLRIPKEFLEPLGVDNDKRPLVVRIRAEKNKRGQNYIAAWVEGK